MIKVNLVKEGHGLVYRNSISFKPDEHPVRKSGLLISLPFILFLVMGVSVLLYTYRESGYLQKTLDRQFEKAPVMNEIRQKPVVSQIKENERVKNESVEKIPPPSMEEKKKDVPITTAAIKKSKHAQKTPEIDMQRKTGKGEVILHGERQASKPEKVKIIPPSTQKKVVTKPIVSGQTIVYSLQVGVFSDEENAREMENMLKGMGFAPERDFQEIRKREFTVVAGRFSHKESAEQARERIGENGVPAQMREFLKGRYVIEAGRFADEKAAGRVLKSLYSLGFRGYVEKKEKSVNLIVVKAGVFPNESSALAAQRQLVKKKIKSLVVKEQLKRGLP